MFGYGLWRFFGVECEAVSMSRLVNLICVCCTMIPDNNLGADGAIALTPALEHLSQLTFLALQSV